jgi:hypothetical protein
MALLNCIICGKEFCVRPARIAVAKCCSNKCRGKLRSQTSSGVNHPDYQSGPRSLICQHCGKEFRQGKTEAISEFRKRKFCSMECAKYGQRRLYGDQHPLFKSDSRRANRRGKHGAWARAVISRDNAICQRCGATDVELHAHHIKPFAEYPELRWDLANGLTLCSACHWAEHTVLEANGVNSGNIQPGKAEDNPEPSNRRKPIEGVTTRGRAYRRWQGECEWCQKFLSKRWSDVSGKAHIFCSYQCAANYKWANGILKPRSTAVISSTSAPHESDDIV